MPDVVCGHVLLGTFFARAHENVRIIIVSRIVLLETGRADCKSSVNALTTSATVPLALGLEHGMSAGACLGNQVRNSMAGENLDDFDLCLVEVGIINNELPLRDCRTETLEKVEGYRMGGSGRA